MNDPKTTSILKEGLEERIKTRIDKLRSREGYLWSQRNPLYPLKKKREDKVIILERVKKIENNLSSIETLIKAVRKFVPNIWDEADIAAAYLLLGKSFRNLETIIILAKKGNSFEIVELARSGKESLDLIFLFLQDGQEDLLNKWFNGKIIENEKARKAFHKAINKFKKGATTSKQDLPIEDLKKNAYWLYSLYSHNSYAALLDTVDVFKEDLDFEKSAGFHYTVRNFHVIEDLTFNILFGLKNVFIKYNDQENLTKTEEILKAIGFVQASQGEIDEVMKKYYKN